MASLKGPGAAQTSDGEKKETAIFAYLLGLILDRFWAPNCNCPWEMEHGDNWPSY